jgi:Ca-activated chloride channel homolog
MKPVGRRDGPLAIAAITAVAATAFLGWQVRHPSKSPPCVPLTLTVASSEEKSALLQLVAADYGRRASTPGQCVSISVLRIPSGQVEAAVSRGWNAKTDGGPPPDVWSPAATTWLRLLDHHLRQQKKPSLVQASVPSLFTSPLVIGMPKPMGLALGWPAQRLGWSDILGLSTDPRGWARYGHPEWGAFRLGKTNPNFSTSGLHALIGTYFAATGQSSQLTPDRLGDPDVLKFVAGVESSVVHYGKVVSTFSLNLRAADEENAALSYISAIAMEEKQVWDYNQGNPSANPAVTPSPLPPRIPLVAFYPRDGTLVADHPYAILDAPWMTGAKRQLASGFLRYLQDPARQRQFQLVGFRDQAATAGSEISPANGLLPGEPNAFLRPPTGEVIMKIQQSWTGLRKRARVLIVIEDSAATTGADRNRTAAAIREGLNELSPNDQAGLWSFPSGEGPSSEPRELVPVAPVSQSRSRIADSIARLSSPPGRIDLLHAVRKAVASMQAGADPNRINAVVVIASGRNDDPTDTDLNGLLRDLRTQAPSAWVRVFTVAYGARPNSDVLDKMARAARAGAYNASKPSDLNRVFIDVVSNF